MEEEEKRELIRWDVNQGGEKVKCIGAKKRVGRVRALYRYQAVPDALVGPELVAAICMFLSLGFEFRAANHAAAGRVGVRSDDRHQGIG